jgi:hypothetical protein
MLPVGGDQRQRLGRPVLFNAASTQLFDLLP